MRLHLMIPRDNLRIARRGAPITRPRHPRRRSRSRSRGTLLLRRVLRLLLLVLLLGQSGVARSAVVHVALGPRLGARLLLVALRGLAVAAVVHKDVDAAVLGVGRDLLVVVVVGRLGVLGDDVPGVEEAGDLMKGGGVSGWLDGVGVRCGWRAGGSGLSLRSRG